MQGEDIRKQPSLGSIPSLPFLSSSWPYYDDDDDQHHGDSIVSPATNMSENDPVASPDGNQDDEDDNDGVSTAMRLLSMSAPSRLPSALRQQRSAWEIASSTPMTTLPHFHPSDAGGPLYQGREEAQQGGLQPSWKSGKARRRRRRCNSVDAEITPNTSGNNNTDSLLRSCLEAATTKSSDELCAVKTDNQRDRMVEQVLPQIQQPLLLPVNMLKKEGNENIDSSYGSTSESAEDNNYTAIAETTGTPATTVARKESEPTPLWICILYGLINASIVLPVLMSFGSIIYRNEFFTPYQAVLVKLTVFSGIVHQVCFSCLSSLPFAVGQVQDAGLIFLSGMAGDIVAHGAERDARPEQILATTTIGLALCTAVLGVALVGIGRCGWAQYVQQLPTSVVGGYLAYIGWFCGVAGIGIMAGSSSVTPSMLFSSETRAYIWPGLVGGICIYIAVRALRHVAVLPACIALELLLFYLVLWWTGTSIAEATERGWVRRMDPPPQHWYQTWDYFRFDMVMWGALPRLVLSEISMIFVVALSSSLDVAAIELELKQQRQSQIQQEPELRAAAATTTTEGVSLDYNHELTTVGWSNFLAGLTGGYTGSYIFSQTIFVLRSGVRSRSAGWVLAGAQLVTVVAPYPVLSAVPNFFFGSLLTMICVDLMVEWLWQVRSKVSPAEYAVALATFLFVQFLNVEFGILSGLGLYLISWKMGFSVSVMTEPPPTATASQANDGESR